MRAALTSNERLLMCVVLVDVDTPAPVDADATRPSNSSFIEVTEIATPTGPATLAEPHGPELKALREAAEAHGARLQRIAGRKAGFTVTAADMAAYDALYEPPQADELAARPAPVP